MSERAAIRLQMHQTQIPGIPSEVLSQSGYDDCHARLLAHVTDLKAGAEPVSDVKVIVIGNGRIGKTQICNRLRGEEFEENAVSTHGITVTRAVLPMGRVADESSLAVGWPPSAVETLVKKEPQALIQTAEGGHPTSQFRSANRLDADLNLWDFGGQDLYHGTHALFLKSRAIFVVVWTPNSETTEDCEYGGMRFRNQPLPYWLDYVRHAAGQGCPVVLVQNQCDSPQDEVPQPPVAFRSLAFHPEPQAKRAANQDESAGSASSQTNSTWRAKTNAIGMESQSTTYDFAFPQIVHYSAKYDRKRDSLNDALREAVKFLHDREGISTIGKGRMRVRRQLQQWLDEDAPRKKEHRQHRTLTQAQFRQLCEDVGGVSSPESLLDYLHNAGIVFYRPGLFRDEIVLDQSWALDAIYTVFNREQCYRQLRLLGGRFTRSLLEALAWREYSRSEQELFLSLMTSCGICFVHRDEDQKRGLEAEYVAPDLLPDRTDIAPQLAGRWNEVESSPQRAWDFSFLSPSVARSIISRVGTIAGETAVYWKYGVWFYDATTRSCALIEQQMQDDRRGRIVLSAQGDRSRELLATVTRWIGQSIEQDGSVLDVGSEAETRRTGGPPVSRSRSSWNKSDILLDAQLESRSDGQEVERTGSPFYEDPAAKLRFANPPRPTNEHRACVSYAWKEERSSDPERAGKVDEFCSSISDAGLRVVRDTTDLPLFGRIREFMRDVVGHSGRVFVFLSDAYLRSPNCMFELLEIWRSNGSDTEGLLDCVRVFPMPGLRDLRDAEVRLDYADHWEREAEKLEKLVQIRAKRVSEDTFLEYTRIRQFPDVVDKILATIANQLQTGDLDHFIQYAIEDIRRSSSSRKL